jgi:hypothetical protein
MAYALGGRMACDQDRRLTTPNPLLDT